MIGRLTNVVLDAADTHGLARFYSELLGWPITRVDGDWIDVGEGPIKISVQHAPDHQPPRWPDPAFPQQFHLDLDVDDIEEAEPKALALGAKLLDSSEPTFRVYADPAGHPFCLCWG
jgi:hypothetical protein